MTDPTAEILGRLMLAFRGTTVPRWLENRLSEAPLAGITLFRAKNVRSPGQLRRLTASLQTAAAVAPIGDGLPLLIAADQEGGQLLALGDGWTPFAGPMAIGATGDAELAERVGRAIGRELRATGVNVDYAPVLDIARRPDNPALGIRAFGDDPIEVGRLGMAWAKGLQSAGVAATGKHFPGAGGAGSDPHHGLAVVERSIDDVAAEELVPFHDAIEAGVRLIMSGHFAAPGLTGSRSLPSTLSRHVMHELLRDELGFDGVSITDALDMGALAQGASQAVDILAALDAGVDLLLATADRAAQRRIESTLRRAAQVDFIEAERARRSLARIAGLRRWVGTFEDPPLDIVGSREHRALAVELARRSLTLVRDDARLLPLRLAPDARILVIMPAPRDLTPADTSSFVTPTLAAALRAHHPGIDDVITSHPPTPAEIAALRDRAEHADVIVVGTISASADAAQADLVRALAGTGRPLVTIALRTPWDLAAYPEARTHLCTYSILPESMDALAAGLFGEAPFPGHLPVAIEGIADRGHGLVDASVA